LIKIDCSWQLGKVTPILRFKKLKRSIEEGQGR
jgi:hypothetical protein